MKLFRSNLLPVLLLGIFVLLFYFPLFYPKLQLFVTPGYGNNDILDFNYPLKELLSQSLKLHTLPVWTDTIGTGFPILAESQMQTFSLLNLLLFSLLPTAIAFNLGYVISSIMLAIGMYLVAREEKFSKLTSFFCAFIFTFSGAHIVRFAHYNILLGFSYVPFIYLVVRRIMKTPATRLWVALPLLLSQFIFSSHLPTVFTVAGFFVILLFIFWLIQGRAIPGKILIAKVVIVAALTIGLSAIQLIPTYEYANQSIRDQAFKLFTTPKRGLTYQNLVQFLLPTAFGDIRNGTLTLSPTSQNVWEVFNYIGVLPLIMAIFTIFAVKRNALFKWYWITIGALAILALESTSPLHFIYAFPPFTFFRVYTRFLAFAFFLLIMLSGHTMEYLRQHGFPKIFIVLIIAASMTDVWFVAKGYNPTLPLATILREPETAGILKTMPPGRVYSLDTNISWYTTFTTMGWKDTMRYDYMKNSLAPNRNILYGIPQASAYVGLPLRKQAITESIINNGVALDPASRTETMMGAGIRMLRMLSVTYLITSHKMTNPEFFDIATVPSPYQEIQPFYIYQLTDSKPLYYLAHRVKQISGIRELHLEFQGISVDDTSDAIISGGPAIEAFTGQHEDSIHVTTYTATKKSFTYSTNADSYFLLSTYNYPGWSALLDGKNVPLYDGNISSMAVFAPKGTHTLTFTFIPTSLYVGAAVTGISVLIYAGILIVSVYRKRY